MPPVRGNLSPARGRLLLLSQPRGMEQRGLVPGGHSGGHRGLLPPQGTAAGAGCGSSASKSAEPSRHRDSSKIAGSDEDLAPALPGGEEKYAGAGGALWSDFHSSARHWDFVKPRQFASSWWCDQEAGPVSPPAACVPATQGSPSIVPAPRRFPGYHQEWDRPRHAPWGSCSAVWC